MISISVSSLRITATYTFLLVVDGSKNFGSRSRGKDARNDWIFFTLRIAPFPTPRRIAVSDAALFNRLGQGKDYSCSCCCA